MKLKIKEFESLAKRQGYKDGEALFLRLGGGWKTYKSLKRGI